MPIAPGDRQRIFESAGRFLARGSGIHEAELRMLRVLKSGCRSGCFALQGGRHGDRIAKPVDLEALLQKLDIHLGAGAHRP